MKGRYWLLYMIVDVWSRKTVAARVHPNESDELASALIEEACLREGVSRGELVIHGDNGPAMKGKTILAMMQDLGIVPSFSRPRVSDDNPYSEALFRTMRYRPTYPDRPFPSLEAAQTWVDEFVRWYNEGPPAQRHPFRDACAAIRRPRPRHPGEPCSRVRGCPSEQARPTDTHDAELVPGGRGAAEPPPSHRV